jgi:hypothetical protein
MNATCEKSQAQNPAYTGRPIQFQSLRSLPRVRSRLGILRFTPRPAASFDPDRVLLAGTRDACRDDSGHIHADQPRWGWLVELEPDNVERLL